MADLFSPHDLIAAHMSSQGPPLAKAWLSFMEEVGRERRALVDMAYNSPQGRSPEWFQRRAKDALPAGTAERQEGKTPNEDAYFLERGAGYESAIGVARLHLKRGDPEKALAALDRAVNESSRKHVAACIADGAEPDVAEFIFGGQVPEAGTAEPPAKPASPFPDAPFCPKCGKQFGDPTGCFAEWEPPVKPEPEETT